MDKDPTPGDPDRVRNLAKNLHDFADDVSKVLRDIKGMAGEDAILTWAGKTAESFTSEFEDAPGKLKKLKKSYEMAGDALSTYWPELERAQALADKALVKGREAQGDLSSAQTRLTSADSWMDKAGKEADKYKDDKDSGKDVPKPDPDKVKAATRNATSAEKAQTAAKSDVSAAKSNLDAAKKMAEDARKMRENAAGTAKKKLEEASDAGIQNRKWWEEVGDWVTDNWDTIVAVCKVVVAVLGVIAMIIGGPILGAIVLIAALVVLADTLNKYANGEAGLLDVAFAALDCIPGMKGITSAAKLAKGLKGLKGGLKGLKSARNMLGRGKDAFGRTAKAVWKKLTDPVDLATGQMFLPQTDIELPGILPLAFRRRVASDYRTGYWFGPTWSSTIDQRLEVDEQGIIFVTEDGLLLAYPHPQAPGAAVLPETGPRWPLVRLDAGGYRVDNPINGQSCYFAEPDEGLALLARISDRNSNTVDFDYAEDGTPLAIRHCGGYHLKLTVDDDRITALTLVGAGDDGSDVTVKRYGYVDGNLTSVTNSSGLPLRFTYDDRLRVTSWTDTNHSRYEYTYDDQDRCIAEGGEAGHVAITLDYEGTNPDWPDCRVTTLTTADDAVTRFVINGRCQVVAEIDARGGVTRTSYDSNHHVLSRTDQLGHTTNFVNNASGQPIRVTRPDDTVLRFAYNDLGAPTLVGLPGGAEWHREYDERGNCVSLTDPAGAITGFTYDASGHLIAVTDALGRTRTVRTNPAGLPVSVTDPLGSTTAWQRDAFGRVTAHTDPLGHTVRLTWTVEGHLTRRTGPEGASELWTYDGEGNCTSHHTPTGAVSRFEYTHFDLPSARIDPDGARYEFTHDSSLRLVGVTNPQGLTWAYRHDAAGNLVEETDFDGRGLTYEHDLTGRLVSRTNSLGNTVHYEHDNLGRTTHKVSEGQVTAFEYDLDSRLVRATGPGTSLLLGRDLNGRVTSETIDGRHMTYGHDVLGRRVRRTTPTGATTTWTYDAGGNRTELTSSGHTLRFGHDRSGREVTRSIDNAATVTHIFDELGRLTTQSVAAGTDGREVQRRSYAYDGYGGVTGIDDQLFGGRRFELDTVGRVIAVDAHGWSERYAYDEAGNQTHGSWPATHTGGDSTGSRDYSGTRLTRAGHTRYEHDALGRTVLRQKKRPSRKPDTWRYTWDAEDRLTAVVTPDSTNWRYLYDPLGRRTAKQRLSDDGQSVIEQVDFTWDGNTLCEQTTHSTSLPHRVTLTWDHDGLYPISQTERLLGGESSQEEIDSRFFAIVTDLVGAPTELIGETGDIAWRSRTTLWGSTTWNSRATAYTPLRFPGQYYDPETGLHYNRFRHYDPETARYLTPDPLGLAPAPNTHTYVANPHTWADPHGLSPYPVTRGGNEHTYNISHDASGSGVIADLDGNGILTMMMHNNPQSGSPLRGRQMFDEVMGHFGDRVQGVQGIWVYGDNLGGFNEAVRGGSSLVAAARDTWTGRQAARYGFNRVRIDEAVPRLDGDFDQVLATFRR
ncbi:MAG: RHS repeat-associated core domain-containing protein [Streptomyces sp.]